MNGCWVSVGFRRVRLGFSRVRAGFCRVPVGFSRVLRIDDYRLFAIACWVNPADFHLLVAGGVNRVAKSAQVPGVIMDDLALERPGPTLPEAA
jgi:hypothetical protein